VEEMTKVGIIGCKLRWDMGCAEYSSHVSCFLACVRRKGRFEELSDPVIVSFTSCNGCPGKGRFEKAEVMKKRTKVDVIMLASCCYKPPRCIHIDQSAKDIEEGVKIKVLRGTATKEE
jgi:predicted metal-binding protein